MRPQRLSDQMFSHTTSIIFLFSTPFITQQSFSSKRQNGQTAFQQSTPIAQSPYHSSSVGHFYPQTMTEIPRSLGEETACLFCLRCVSSLYLRSKSDAVWLSFVLYKQARKLILDSLHPSQSNSSPRSPAIACTWRIIPTLCCSPWGLCQPCAGPTPREMPSRPLLPTVPPHRQVRFPSKA